MRKILFLFPIIFLSSCFSIDKPTLVQLIKGSKNVCPLASNMSYIIRNENGKIGEIKIANIQKGNETLCYLNSASMLDPSISANLNDFFTRKFYKISDVLYMMYDAKINDSNSIYFIRKTNNGWLIYTDCKNGDKDCPIAQSIDAFEELYEKEVMRQKPTYLLEATK